MTTTIRATDALTFEADGKTFAASLATVARTTSRRSSIEVLQAVRIDAAPGGLMNGRDEAKHLLMPIRLGG